MKNTLFLLLTVLCVSTYAAEQTGNQEAEPPSHIQSEEPVPGEPQVTITKQSEQTIEEYRVGGRLYMIKITPKHGHPYYLIDDRGDGRFARQEGLDSGVRVPQWVIKKF